MTTLSLRQTIALVALFVAASTTFIALDNRRTIDPVKTVLLDVVQPVARAIHEVADGSESDLERELVQVRAENAALRAEIVALQDAANEAEQLRAQLDVEEAHPDWEVVRARVINPDPTSYQKYITIDKGWGDGIKVGMAVVDPYVLVGVVTSVEEHSARITLAIDRSLAVGARIVPRGEDGSGGDGIAYGAWQEGGRMVLRHVDRDLVPVEGDFVVTAGAESASRTTMIPPDVPIGEVIGEPRQDVQSDTLTIDIVPFCDFERLKVVTIIISDGS